MFAMANLDAPQTSGYLKLIIGRFWQVGISPFIVFMLWSHMQLVMGLLNFSLQWRFLIAVSGRLVPPFKSVLIRKVPGQLPSLPEVVCSGRTERSFSGTAVVCPLFSLQDCSGFAVISLPPDLRQKNRNKLDVYQEWSTSCLLRV